jgi:cytochrome c
MPAAAMPFRRCGERIRFNWGAGMASVKAAAGFIKANITLGQGYTLKD